MLPTKLNFQKIKETFTETVIDDLANLATCSQKGLVEMFDSSIGAATVTMPYGGKYQLTPEEAMVAKIPLLEGETDTATVMAYGFIPSLGIDSNEFWNEADKMQKEYQMDPVLCYMYLMFQKTIDNNKTIKI